MPVTQGKGYVNIFDEFDSYIFYLTTLVLLLKTLMTYGHYLTYVYMLDRTECTHPLTSINVHE